MRRVERARRPARRVRGGPARGRGGLQRRRPLRRAPAGGRPPRRDPGDGRRPRRGARLRRPRVLDPAPPPEAHRGGAGAPPARRDAHRHAAGGPAGGEGAGATGAPARWSSWSTPRATSSSWSSTRACRWSTRSPSWSPASTWWPSSSAWPPGGLLSRTGVRRGRGHAIECRINAEDPCARLPPGRRPPATTSASPSGPGIRVDTHCEPGESVPPHYDSLLGKLCVWAADRPRAIARLRRALDETSVTGIPTTLPLLRDIAHRRALRGGPLHDGLPGRARGASCPRCAQDRAPA